MTKGPCTCFLWRGKGDRLLAHPGKAWKKENLNGASENIDGGGLRVEHHGFHTEVQTAESKRGPLALGLRFFCGQALRRGPPSCRTLCEALPQCLLHLRRHEVSFLPPRTRAEDALLIPLLQPFASGKHPRRHPAVTACFGKAPTAWRQT